MPVTIQVTTENPDPAQATLTQPVPTEADAQNLVLPQVVDLPTVPAVPAVPVPTDLASSQSLSMSMSNSSSPLPKPTLLRPSSRSSTPSEVATPTSDLVNDATAAAQPADQLSKTLMESLYPNGQYNDGINQPQSFPSTLDPILEHSEIGQELNKLSESIKAQALSKFEEIADEEDDEVDVEKELGLPELPNVEANDEPDLLMLDFAEMSRVQQQFWLNELMRKGLELAGKLRVGI